MLQQASVSGGRQITLLLKNKLASRLPGATCGAPLCNLPFENGPQSRRPRRERQFVQSSFASKDEACAVHQHPLRLVKRLSESCIKDDLQIFKV